MILMSDLGRFACRYLPYNVQRLTREAGARRPALRASRVALLDVRRRRGRGALGLTCFRLEVRNNILAEEP